MEKSLMAQTDKLGVFRVEAPLTGNVKEITIDQLEIFSGFSSGLGKNPEHPYCLQILDIPFYSTVECLLKSALCVQLGVVVLLILHCYFPLALQRGMRPQPLVATTRVFVTDRVQGFTANSIRRSSVKSWWVLTS
jgi:hypothetical protein